MNKDTTIVTESDFDAKVLIKLLQDKTFESKFEVLSASGYSSALSKVRTLLTLEDKKVLLILDTDTNDINEIKQKKAFVNTYVDTNNNKRNFKAVWAIPEFEIMFLNNKKFLNMLTEKKLSKDLLKVGKSSPRAALESISNQPREKFLSFLDYKEIRDEFFEEKLMKEIYNFLYDSGDTTSVES